MQWGKNEELGLLTGAVGKQGVAFWSGGEMFYVGFNQGIYLRRLER
jgi:hypothetical protein